MVRLARQTLIALGGLQFTGKSTIGRRLSAQLDIPTIGLDHIRRLFWPNQSGRGNLDLDLKQRNAAHPIFTAIVDQFLAGGDSLIIERLFSQREYQETMRDICEKREVLFKLVILYVPECCEREVISERAARRPVDDPSPASDYEADYLRMKGKFEWPKMAYIPVDTTRPLDDCIGEILRFVGVVS